MFQSLAVRFLGRNVNLKYLVRKIENSLNVLPILYNLGSRYVNFSVRIYLKLEEMQIGFLFFPQIRSRFCPKNVEHILYLVDIFMIACG